MQALFLVLHKVEKLDDLLAALQKSGINGGTIIESKGMFGIDLTFVAGLNIE